MSNTATTVTDADGDRLTFTVVAGPAHGTLAGTAPDLACAPAPDSHGHDFFTLMVSDGMLHSPAATVSITVQSVAEH